MIKVTAFTDGSAYWKAGQGGCGAYIQYDDGSAKEISKGFDQTKTGRMEIMAVLLTLKEMPLNKHIDLKIYSDSQYVVKAFTEKRLFKWMRDWNGVANVDLWKQVIHELMKRDILIDVEHVIGHQEVVDDITAGNAIADFFADYKQFETRQKDLNDEEWLNYIKNR